MSEPKLTRADVREEIARALRMLREEQAESIRAACAVWPKDDQRTDVLTAVLAATDRVAARLTAAEPAREEQPAPDPLPPLVGPYSGVVPAERACREWERIAREERAAREQERAELANATAGWSAASQSILRLDKWNTKLRERAEKAERRLAFRRDEDGSATDEIDRLEFALEMARIDTEKAERERDEARDTAARLAVERNALAEQRDGALKALGEK